MDGAGKSLYFFYMQPRNSHADEGTITTWSLYGEPGDAMPLDWMHAEPIQERSRLHDYSIRPHRHALLFQLLYLTAGEATLSLDGRLIPLAPPTAVTLPPLVVHGFEFTADVQGTVLTVFQRDLAALFASAPALLAHFERPRVISLAGYGREASGLADGMATIARELARHEIGRDQVLSACLSLQLTTLRRVEASRERSRGARPEMGDSRAVALVLAYQHLVAQHFASHAPVARYAAQLGITASHLNRVCRAVAGASALELINRRLVLEARRQLAFTNLSVKRVAAMLGFDDPAYFTRFFGREAGISPSAFRADLLAAGRRDAASHEPAPQHRQGPHQEVEDRGTLQRPGP